MGSYEVFFNIDNQRKYNQYINFPANFIAPLRPLISPLHKYHVAMASHNQVHLGFSKENSQGSRFGFIQPLQTHVILNKISFSKSQAKSIFINLTVYELISKFS